MSVLPVAACAFLALAVALVPSRSGSHRLAALGGRPAAAARRRPVPTAAVSGAGVLIGLLALGPAGALAGGVLAAGWHRQQARTRTSRATTALTTELADALGRIVEELRAGAHPAAALAGVEADGPLARAVLGPAARAAALGDGIPAALAAEADRRPDVSRDLRRAARTWALADRHGVPPADLLTGVLADMRWRLGAAARARAQLAGPRATAAVLTALPGLLLALGELVGAGPLTVLRSSALGQLLVVVGVGLAAVGAGWTARITRATVPR